MDEKTFDDLVSGRKSGVVAAGTRLCFLGLSWLYRIGVAARNTAFDIGLKQILRADVPVISVGNITTGGTGKTPVVAWLANWIADQDIRVGILSRGYKAVDGSFNDEKMVLDALCPGIPHLQSPNRVAAAKRAVQEHQCQLLILDDGFQHRRLSRSLDIVLIDCMNPFGYERLLPRGKLREPISSVRRADLVILTRADQISPADRENLQQRLIRGGYRGDCVAVAFQPQRLINVAGESTDLDTIRHRKALAFCGIGNPHSFEALLKSMSVKFTEFRVFPDHHHYESADFETLDQEVSRSDAELIVTTQKDLVKINQKTIGSRPLWAVQIGAKILTHREELERTLQNVLPASL